MQEMGINKLANMYLGNPQPLAQKVQQAQQQVKPGQLPPDLEQAIALQKIQEMRAAAQNQQAMQAGGPQPTVMDKLRQMVQPQMQAQPQGMPPQMPGQPPQGVNQLPAQFNLAGGGIVAFDDGGDVPSDEDMPAYASVWRATRMAKEAEARKRMEEERARNMAQVNANPSEMRPVMKNDPRMRVAPLNESVGHLPPPPAAAPPAQTTPPAAPQAGLQAPAARPAAQRPAPQQMGPAPQGLDALLESGIRESMGRNQEAEAQKTIDKQRELSGMSEYQKQMADMVTRREAAQKAAVENRTPEWVRGLQALGGAPVKGGLGMVLAQAGRGATAARDTYGEEDAKYANELDALRKAAMDAQLKGNMDLAKTYTDRYHQVAQEKQAALQSGVGLQSNRNTVAQREQAERHHNEQMNENRAARLAAGNSGVAADRQNLAELKTLQANLQKQTENLTLSKERRIALETQLAQVNNEIAKMAGLASGATSAKPGAVLKFDSAGNLIKG